MLTVHYRLEWSTSVLCSLFLLVTGDAVSAMKWRRLRKLPPLVTGFSNSSPLYKWRIQFHSSPQRGRCCLTLASPRHKTKAAVWLNKFLEKIINLRIIKKLAYLGKIRQGPPPQTCDLQVCLKSATFFSNSSLFPQICGFFWKLAGPGPKVATGGWGGGGGMAWVAILFPSCLGSY